MISTSKGKLAKLELIALVIGNTLKLNHNSIFLISGNSAILLSPLSKPSLPTQKSPSATPTTPALLKEIILNFGLKFEEKKSIMKML